MPAGPDPADPPRGGGWRWRAGVLAACVVVALAVAWYVGARSAPQAPPPPPGSVRLGPEAGEDVAAYLGRLPAELPPAGARAPALVQFGAALMTAAALDATAGTTPLTAVFQVPIDRVQTALRFEALEPGVVPATAIDSARARAQRAAEATGATGGPDGGRAAAVAAAESAALADPACPCVVALVVEADRAGLDAVAGRSGVRAVHAAPPGTTPRELALAPLLPGQVERADPLPDDGPVPPA
ncbi:MAG TPA: hypothetical protein VD813_11290 [Pseudonocardia sp.]|nr:hypothetical protein [Pseudonocardia sp.]